MKCAFFSLVCFIVISGCSTYNKPFVYKRDGNSFDSKQELPNDDIIQSIYLVGDAGKSGKGHSKDVFDFLKPLLDREENDKASIIFLGDNIYPAGLPVEEGEQRDLALKALVPQLDLVKDFKGVTYFIPGNHDWNFRGIDGVQRVKEQEHFVENYYKEEGKVKWVPNNACADLEYVEYGEEVVVLFLDSEWWLHNWHKAIELNFNCKIGSRNEFLERLTDFFIKNRKKQIIVAMHHPIYTNGEHGGKFGLKEHLFPLTELKQGLYIPIPIIGSLYPVTRSVAGPSQDQSHQLYQDLIREIKHILFWNKINDVVFVAGHEHNLQYFHEDKSHFIVSGSGSKESYLSKSEGIEFAYSQKGFARLILYKDRSVWLEFIAEDTEGIFKKVYQRKLVEKQVKVEKEFVSGYDDVVLEDSITAVINDRYRERFLKDIFLGRHYRRAWSDVCTYPIIDLENTYGGFDVLKTGGGLASLSIRLKKRGTNHEYVLRSVDKNALNAFSYEIGSSIFGELFQDQISSIHPFSATVVANMAASANIYHTSPEVWYLKNQKGLNIFNEFIDEGVFILEERADENWENKKSFGYSKNVIGYNKLIEKLIKNSKNVVDQDWTLRSRIYDLWIHDWDRHDDQWRWAEFKQDSINLYRPIPRDRDQAFYKTDGLLPWFTATFVQKKFKNFKEDLKHPHWQSYNARFFDKQFLNQMTRLDWIRETKFLQENLTNEVINKAFENTWLKQDADEYVEEIQAKLYKRRDNLMDISMRLYDFQAKNVDILGSKDRDRFLIELQKNGSVKITGFSMNDEGKHQRIFYQRSFVPTETNWINIYGLQSKDVFEIIGQNKNKIKIRIIGGKGNDIVKDLGTSTNNRKSVFVHDLKDNMVLEKKSNSLKDNRSDNFSFNLYNRYEYEYNNLNPLINFGFFRDDGFFIGTGFTSTTHSWKKRPYSTKNYTLFNYAPSTGSFRGVYKSDFIGLIGGLDFSPDVLISKPFNINYFGLGASPKVFDDEYYRVRLNQFSFKPFLKKQWSENRIKLFFGPTYEYYNALRNEGRITDSDLFSDSDFEGRNFLGFETKIEIDAVYKNTVRDFTGLRFSLGTHLAKGLSSKFDERFVNWYGSISSYFGFRINQSSDFVIALKFGSSKIIGEFPFYNYISLGQNKIRGYNRDRFRGDLFLFQKIDFRYTLGYWSNLFLPIEFGIVGGFDIGGIRDPQLDDMSYHHSFSTGFWISPLRYVVIHPYISKSKDETFFTLSLGFDF